MSVDIDILETFRPSNFFLVIIFFWIFNSMNKSFKPLIFTRNIRNVAKAIFHNSVGAAV